MTTIRERTISAQIEGIPMNQLDLYEMEDGVEETVLLEGSPLKHCRTESVTSRRACEWERVLEHAIKAVVSIKVNEVKTIDTGSAGVYNASGFVVDKKLGLILTNRHVISCGPVVAHATFSNYEEVPLEVVFIDPIHDFGFLRFDPARVKYLDVVELQLRPEEAKIGTEIRVVGNDSGEKLSIQQGIIARLDREAPPYGLGNYNDFNTFYLQACSGTTGGSSGSPVLNVRGHAVALNAGAATNGNQAFYFPLFCVQRALELLRQGLQVDRGTLMLDFEMITLYEAHRLGLTAECENQLRQSGRQTVFVCSNIIPGSSSDSKLAQSDVLLKLNDEIVDDFVQIESILNRSVGKSVSVEVFRDDSIQKIEVDVCDLNAIGCPQMFVEFGDSVIHALSYQNARSYSVPVGTCFVSAPGYPFGSAGLYQKAHLVSVNGAETKNLQQLISVLRTLHVGQQVAVSFRLLNSDVRYAGVMRLSDTMTEFRIFEQIHSEWQVKEVCRLLPKVDFVTMQHSSNFVEVHCECAKVAKLSRTLVYIKSFLSMIVDCSPRIQNEGCGIIVDEAMGLIVCDRSSVPSSLCDVELSFSNSNSIKGEVVLMHPTQNIVFVKYDTRIVDSAGILASAQLIAEPPISCQQVTYLVGLNPGGSCFCRKSEIAGLSHQTVQTGSPPKFTNVNVEAYSLCDPVPVCIGGVLCSSSGSIQALWTSAIELNNGSSRTINYGLPALYIQHVLYMIKKGLTNPMIDVKLNLLPAILQPLPLSEAKHFGMSDVWMSRLSQAGTERHSVMQVVHPWLHGSALFQGGDIILSACGYLLTSAVDVQILQQNTTRASSSELLVCVLRNQKEINVTGTFKQVTAVPQSCMELVAKYPPLMLHPVYIQWAGCIVQNVTDYVLESCAEKAHSFVTPMKLEELPYVSSVLVGSPMQASGFTGGSFILRIDGLSFLRPLDATRELPLFGHCMVRAIKMLQQNNEKHIMARVQFMSRSGSTKYVSVLLNQLHWPSFVLVPKADGGSLKIEL